MVLPREPTYRNCAASGSPRRFDSLPRSQMHCLNIASLIRCYGLALALFALAHRIGFSKFRYDFSMDLSLPPAFPSGSVSVSVFKTRFHLEAMYVRAIGLLIFSKFYSMLESHLA